MADAVADTSMKNGKRSTASLAAANFERDGSAWWEVGPLSEQRYRLRLGGLFQTGWLASLCSALAKRGLSIHTAHARLAHDGAWVAELSVTALDSTVDVMSLPYLSMAQQDDEPASGELSLEAYSLEQTRDHGGTLRLELRAKDTLGLVGKLLKLGRRAGLYAIEMHIETHDELAHDSIWLASDARGDLTEARGMLDGLLHASLRGPR